MSTPRALSDPSPVQASRRVLTVNLSLMTIQIVTGWLTGSNAIVADGVHTCVDLVVDAVLLAALAPRARVLPAWLPQAFVALLLTLTGAELLWQGASATGAPGGEAQLGALLVALTVIVARECVARHLHTVSSALEHTHADAANLLAAGAWHARIDALSAGAAAAGALGTMAGFGHVDQFATLAIGGMMCCMGLLHEGSVLRLGYRFVR
jgi:divalent metal cation (Fe/Co/Zn/Cd) transporter